MLIIRRYGMDITAVGLLSGERELHVVSNCHFHGRGRDHRYRLRVN